MNAAIYARVSTDIQAEHGHSIEAQIADCKAKAQSLGADRIDEFIDDGYSGAFIERPHLEALRASLRAQNYQYVVIYALDRLSRNLSHQLLLADEIEQSGARLVFCNESYEASAEGRLFFAIRGAFAGYEREKIRERTIRGKKQMLLKGMVVADSHVYGYDFDSDARQYIINDYEASVIRMIYKMYLDGYGGIAKILQYLNANIDKYPPPNGVNWSSTTINNILKREMYTGRFYANRVRNVKIGAKKTRKEARPKSEWIEMSCPRIISDDDFAEAQKIIKDNHKFARHKNHQIHICQGLIYCANCGHRLYVICGHGETKYYACRRRDMMTQRFKSCGAHQSKCDIVDDVVWNLIRKICESPAKLSAYIAANAPHPDRPHADADKQKRKLDKIRRERKAIMSWYSQNLIDESDAEQRLKNLKAAEDAIKANIAQEHRRESIEPVDICKYVHDCSDSPEARQRVLRRLIDKIYLRRIDDANRRGPHKLFVQIYFRA